MPDYPKTAPGDGGLLVSHAALRGVAALMVMFFHYAIKVGGDAPGILERAYTCVDFFFVLSGFVMCHVHVRDFEKGVDGRGYLDFLGKRFARIYPLHLLALVATVFITAAGGVIISDYLPQLLAQVFLVQAWGVTDKFIFNYPAWSVSAELGAYLAFPFLVATLSSQGRTICLAAFAVLLYVVVAAETDELRTQGAERLSLLRALAGFCLGMVVWRLRFLVLNLSATSISLAQFAAIGAMLAVMSGLGPAIVLAPCFAALTLLTADDRGLVGALIRNRRIKATALRLGDWSYAIYLLHVPVIGFVFLVTPQLSVFSPFFASPLAEFALASCVTIAASILVFRFYETPARAHLRRRFHDILRKNGLRPETVGRPGGVHSVSKT